MRTGIAVGIWVLGILLVPTFTHTVNGQEKKPYGVKVWQLRGLKAALNDPDPEVREAALRALSDILPQPGSEEFEQIQRPSREVTQEFEQLVPNVLKFLDSPKEEIRKEAIVALGQMGPAAKNAVQILIQQIRNPGSSDSLKGTAITALGNIGATAKAAIPTLIALLRIENPSHACRDRSMKALSRIGPASVPALIGLIEKEGTSVIVIARVLEVLRMIGPAAKSSTASLVKLLKGQIKSSVDRKDVIVTLGSICPSAKVVVPELLKVIRDTKTDTRTLQSAVYALGEIKSSFSPLISLIENPKTSESVRSDIVIALGNLGPPAKPVVPALIKLIQNRARYRLSGEYAITALEDIGPAAKSAVPTLSQVIQDPKSSDDLIKRTIDALVGIGPAAKSAAPALLKVIQNEKILEYIRIDAIIALEKIQSDPKLVMPLLIKLVKSKNEADLPYQEYAVWTLGQLGPAGVSVLLRWIEAKETPDQIRWDAIQSLANPGPDSKKVISFLVEQIRKPTAGLLLRKYARESLSNIGPAAVPKLIELAMDQKASEAVKLLAVRALGEIGAASKPAVPSLIKLIKDRNFPTSFRSNVIDAVYRIGPEANGAVPVLIELLSKSETPGDIRYSALNALLQIGTGPVRKNTLRWMKVLPSKIEFADIAPKLREHNLKNLPVAIELLRRANSCRERFARFKALAYEIAGETTVGEPPLKVSNLLYWIVNKRTLQPELEKESIKKRKELLTGFGVVWNATDKQRNQPLRDLLAERMSDAIAAGGWSISDLKLLQTWHDEFKKAGYRKETAAIRKQIDIVKRLFH
ncbi:MAG: hypothetical protein Tsb009_04370 [Planctomycetaceae bacterium]